MAVEACRVHSRARCPELPRRGVILKSKRRDVWGEKQQLDVSANIMSPEERVRKALALFDLMEKFVERARNPVGGGPLVYDPGDDSLPLLAVPRQGIGRG
jgi:hypothetical protein